jgi:hypothetical protein
MTNTMPAAQALRHPVVPDITRPRMAKANVGIPDIGAELEGKQRLGAAFGRALAKVGWSIDRAGIELDVDAREVGKWVSGDRRGHWDRVYALPDEHATYGAEYQALKEAFVVEQARLVRRVEVVTEIRFSRAANQ